MRKIILTYGLIAGLIVMTFMILSTILFSQDMDTSLSMFIGFTGMFIAFIFVFVGIKNYRDKHNGGKITFLDGFKIGFFIALIASCVYTIVWMLEFHFFMPDFMEKFATRGIADIKASGLNAAEMQAKITEIEEMRENYKNPLFRILYTLAEILPLGIIIALIGALVMKRNPKAAA
jgi:amino acid transporter